MSFKSVQAKLQGEGHSKESAGKILGSAAQKAKNPSANQRKVLGAQGGKKKKRTPPRRSGSKAPAKKAAPAWMKKKAAA